MGMMVVSCGLRHGSSLPLGRGAVKLEATRIARRMTRSTRLLIAAAVTTVLLVPVGILTASVAQAQIVSTFEGAGVDVVVHSADQAALQRKAVAAAVVAVGPTALGVRFAIDRIVGSRARPEDRASLPRLLGNVAALLLGAWLGLGAATVAAAKVALPTALTASVDSGAVSVSLDALSLGWWTLAGMACSAVITAGIGVVVLGTAESD